MSCSWSVDGEVSLWLKSRRSQFFLICVLRGVMHLTTDSYGIEPLDSAPDQHLLYLLRDVTSQPQGCGTHQHEPSNATGHVQSEPVEVHHGEHRRVCSVTQKRTVVLFGCHRNRWESTTYQRFHCGRHFSFYPNHERVSATAVKLWR